MTFEELKLSKPLIETLEISFKEPTKIQVAAIPAILSGANVIGQAPTGTGKTLAYLLPIFEKIDAASSNVQALILSPTYELVMQTARVGQELWKNLEGQLEVELNDSTKMNRIEFRTLGLIGGSNINRQIEALKKKKPQIISASAGRIIELSRKNKLNLMNLKFLVLDEFDRLLDKQNLITIKEVIKLLPKDIQILMFSATATKKALEQSKEFGTFNLIKVDEDLTFAAERQNFYRQVEFHKKVSEVRKLTRRFSITRGLVFINNKFSAVDMLGKLRYDGIKAESLISSSDKMSRKKAIADFKAGKIQLLLSTDLAARGLDIENIDYVINLDFPENAQMYLHRAGRTARAGAEGKVITLVDRKEMHKIKELETALNINFQQL